MSMKKIKDFVYDKKNTAMILMCFFLAVIIVLSGVISYNEGQKDIERKHELEQRSVSYAEYAQTHTFGDTVDVVMDAIGGENFETFKEGFK